MLERGEGVMNYWDQTFRVPTLGFEVIVVAG